MDLQCKFCDKICTNEDGIFVCENGHIASFTQELTDAMQGTFGKSKKQTTRVEGLPEFDTYMFIFTELYLTMKKYLGFKNDVVYKIYLSYFDIKSYELLNFLFMYTILYYSLRVYKERSDEVITIRKFDEIFPYTFYMFIHNKLCDKYSIKRFKYFNKFNILCYRVKASRISDYLMFFGEVFIKTKHDGEFIPGYEENYNLENKRLFRNLVRRDQFIMEKYLRAVASELDFDVTDDLLYHYTRYCDLYLIERRTFVPDSLICCFLFVYFCNSKLEINFQKIQEKLSYSESGESKFRRELNELIFLTENGDNLANFKKYKEEYIKEYEYKEFYHVNKPMNKLKLIFSVYLKVSTSDLTIYIKKILLFFDSCHDLVLFNTFYTYEKTTYIRAVEKTLNLHQIRRMRALARSEQAKYKKIFKKINK